MMDAFFWFSVGLIVGWNVFPQPSIVKNLYDKAVEKVKSYLS